MIDFRLAPEVIAELREIFQWYEGQRVGLGEKFLESLDVGFRRIQRSPDSYEVVYKQYHRLLLEHFPYLIFYETSPSFLTVYGVFHTASNPAAWPKKLRRRRLP